MTPFYKGVTGLNKFLILNCCEGFALWNAGSVFKRAQLLFRHLCKNLGHWGCFMFWIFANMWLWEPRCSLWDPELLKQPRFNLDAKCEWRLFARELCFPSRSPSPSSHFALDMDWGKKMPISVDSHILSWKSRAAPLEFMFSANFDWTNGEGISLNVL